MTRDEAIKVLSNIPTVGRMNGKHLIVKALQMAIEALEAWDKVRESLDRIDRLYINTGAQVIRVYPKWNVDKIIEQHLKEVEDDKG